MTNADYWYRRNELFARIFEQYIQLKLTRNKVKNFFLTARSYDNVMYCDTRLLYKVEPLIDRLVELMRKEQN